MLEGMCVLMLITGATARYRARPGSLQGPGQVGPVKMQRSRGAAEGAGVLGVEF